MYKRQIQITPEKANYYFAMTYASLAPLYLPLYGGEGDVYKRQAQSFNQVPQQQPAYQAPQNVSAAPSDFSMLSDDDPDLPF